jgi:hypothetical protein
MLAEVEPNDLEDPGTSRDVRPAPVGEIRIRSDERPPPESHRIDAGLREGRLEIEQLAIESATRPAEPVEICIYRLAERAVGPPVRRLPVDGVPSRGDDRDTLGNLTLVRGFQRRRQVEEEPPIHHLAAEVRVNEGIRVTPDAPSYPLSVQRSATELDLS